MLYILVCKLKKVKQSFKERIEAAQIKLAEADKIFMNSLEWNLWLPGGRS